MAYFANGLEGDCYTEKYCEHCLNWRDGDCPVWCAHLQFSYEECNSKSNAKQILDMLIPMNPETHFAEQCAMYKPALDEAKKAIDGKTPP